MRPHYWSVWGDVSIDNERKAVAARAEWMRAHKSGANVDLGPEWHASVVAIAAAAFAIDAWYGELVPAIRASGERQARGTPPRNAIILEALKLGFRLGAKTHSWQGELEWLFKEQRDGLVHPLTENEPVVTLVEGVQGSPAHLRHSAPTATRAVDLVVDVLRTCAAAPRTPELAALMSGYQPSIDRLAARRAAA
jgi:hypothetical protein